MLTFAVTAKDNETHARAGVLTLPHGALPTPQFMPVGTNGTVKAILHSTLADMGIHLILANTYHLYLRPGVDVIRAAGGLHRFSGWDRNILTDSGGYQVFSLAPFRKITEEGVRFRSHIDGAEHFLTPESVVDLQRAFGSDILMALDVCTPPGIEYRDALEALETTSSWARRSARRMVETQGESDGNLFGIVQGNFFAELRKRSAEEIVALDLPGVAIGGLSVGEPFSQFSEYLELTSRLLPDLRPRYLMGIGTPDYVFAAVENGIDLFDCVYPTRVARNGAMITRDGLVTLKHAGNRLKFRPVDESCGCATCRTYTVSYLRHLFKAKEILGAMLATHHNLYFMNELVSEIRRNIQEGTFSAFKKSFLARYTAGAKEEWNAKE